MNIQTLMDRIEQPDVQRTLLADYAGPFSIGIGADPQDSPTAVVIVRVADDASCVHAPPHIDVDGQSVRVIVQGNYSVPHKLRRLVS